MHPWLARFLAAAHAANAHPALKEFWPWSLIAATILLLIALEISVLGYLPGVTSLVALQHICWQILGAALGFVLLSILSAFARDIEAGTQPECV